MWELLTRKKLNTDLITAEDYEKYKNILHMISGYLVQYRPDGNVHVLLGAQIQKRHLKLFPTGRGQKRVIAVPGKRWIE
jgi:hypothetical protein